MSIVNGKIFPNTTFPNEIQTLPEFRDLSVSEETDYMNYITALVNGDIIGANEYLKTISKDVMLTAEKLNTLSNTIGAIQETYKNDDSYREVLEEMTTEWLNIGSEQVYLGEFSQSIFSQTVFKGCICYQYLDKSKCINPSGLDIPDGTQLWYVANQNITDESEPMVNTQWTVISIVGEAGQNGVGANWCGEWDASINYSEYNLVRYQGRVYMCLSPNKNNNPKEHPDVWEEEFSVGHATVPVSSEEPAIAVNGGLWFQLI